MTEIDSNLAESKVLDRDQVKKASFALLKFIQKRKDESQDLLDDDDMINLVLHALMNLHTTLKVARTFSQVSVLQTVALTQTPQRRGSDGPKTLKIPHPLHKLGETEICLIVKDLKGEGKKAAKEAIQQQKLSGITKIIGLAKLRSKYEAPEAKRQLCAAYDIFLADSRILPMLPRALGKTFFRKKKQPVPLDITNKQWSRDVQKAVESTYLFAPSGNCLSIRVARSSFTAEQCTENVMAAVEQAVTRLPRKWAGIRAIFLRTADSAALPIFQSLPANVPQDKPSDNVALPAANLPTPRITRGEKGITSAKRTATKSEAKDGSKMSAKRKAEESVLLKEIRKAKAKSKQRKIVA